MHQEQSHTCCPSAKIKPEKLAQGNRDLKKTKLTAYSPRQSYSHGYNVPVCSISDLSAQEPGNLTVVIYYFCWSRQERRMKFKNLCTINMLLEITAKYSLQIRNYMQIHVQGRNSRQRKFCPLGIECLDTLKFPSKFSVTIFHNNILADLKRLFILLLV